MGYRGHVTENPLEQRFGDNIEAIRAFLEGRSATEVARLLDRTPERVRVYFKQYGVPLVAKCSYCGSMEQLAANHVCKSCREKRKREADAAVSCDRIMARAACETLCSAPAPAVRWPCTAQALEWV